MSAEETALRFLPAAAAAQFHKTAPLSRFYGLPPLLQCVFPRERRSAPVEGARLLDNFVQKLALEQSL